MPVFQPGLADYSAITNATIKELTILLQHHRDQITAHQRSIVSYEAAKVTPHTSTTVAEMNAKIAASEAAIISQQAIVDKITTGLTALGHTVHAPDYRRYSR